MRVSYERGVGRWGLLLLAVFCTGCATNVNDLLREARSGDPASVEDAVVEIGEILFEKEAAGAPYTRGDEAGVKYLIEVAEKSDDDLNRARAVGALGRLSRPDVSALFMTSITDRFWAVRLEAGKGLTRRAVPSDAARIAMQLDRESRPEVRIELIRALAKAGGDDALEALLRVVVDRSSRFALNKLSAYEAVRNLSQQTFDLEDQTSWRGYYDKRFRSDAAKEEDDGRSQSISGPARDSAGPPS